MADRLRILHSHIQEQQPPAATSPCSGTAFRVDAKIVIPGRGDPIRDGSVVVEGKTITYVGPAHSAPSVAQVYAVPVVMPGMWDCHVHFVGFSETRDSLPIKLLQEPIPQRTARAVVHAAKAIEAGFTSVREVGGLGRHLVPLIEEKTITGPHIYYAGDILSPTGGHGDLHELPLECTSGFSVGELCDGVPACLRATRLQLRNGASLIKICASGGVVSQVDHPEHQQFSDEELKAIVDEAARAERIVAAHCHGKAGIMAALRAGCKTIEHGSYLDEEAARVMKKQGAILVGTRWIVNTLLSSLESPSIGLSEWQKKKALAVGKSHEEALRIAVKEGVTMALGTDMFVSAGWGTNGSEATFLEKAGMTPLQVIEAATANGPLTLGPQAPRSGQIRAGYDADIIALDRDPLSDLTVLGKPSHITHVWKHGTLVKG